MLTFICKYKPGQACACKHPHDPLFICSQIHPLKNKEAEGKEKRGQCQSTLLPREGGGGRSRRWSEDSEEGERSAVQECVCVYAVLTIVHCVCICVCVLIPRAYITH